MVYRWNKSFIIILSLLKQFDDRLRVFISLSLNIWCDLKQRHISLCKIEDTYTYLLLFCFLFASEMGINLWKVLHVLYFCSSMLFFYKFDLLVFQNWSFCSILVLKLNVSYIAVNHFFYVYCFSFVWLCL